MWQRLCSETLYNESEGPKYDLIAKWVGRNKKILDVGCGTGEFSKRLSNNGNKVVGIELSESNYRIAIDKIKVYHGDFLEIKIGENFDVVLFGDVLEHMHCPDKALSKARKLADEIILCVPNFDFWGAKLLKLFGIRKMRSGILDKNHVYYFNKNIIEEMIAENGLKVIEFSSPPPRRLPGIYRHIIRKSPSIFGYQFIYRCIVIK